MNKTKCFQCTKSY